uniref:Succinate dehydrogenase assembly factor 3 n=1 Tax=Attheya septentrionalis TaxID=420275 RepID=A0A7S2UH10_9STRA|mmetsp:Transcript_23329/g.42099  ORF Transcript_23329/g.42099 Transcript_23329/m.42099 type:complete len:125 (+) Transcript_23329:135-509(+)
MTGPAQRMVALSLYKSLLRAHANYLPAEMRSLGDAYVKAEFRLHKPVTEAAQLEGFYDGWTQYLQQILQTGRAREAQSAGALDGTQARFGKDLALGKDVSLTEEQITQLENLRTEATKPQPTSP